MATATGLVFERIAGRFKLEHEEEISCSGATAVAALQDLEKQRQQRVRRAERSHVAGAKSKILAFLRKHGFKHSEENLNLNLPKRSVFGLVWTYPLHEAAKERDWQMVGFLLDFGADPACKDYRRCDLAGYLDQMRAPDRVWKFLRPDA
ncbi:hypothetical protein AK812_SmicGene18435 [Symbiodinium microadriaticum]|uniref:Uncharacterized protein n=1 Tax=Symbiodinium microadriaticum TaxID=2951 RepID=A0A1Q9DV85_SYMMI|nr:hypothetical protein AK812_SmicGene18435 [Symbiodinium microadriaticum]